MCVVLRPLSAIVLSMAVLCLSTVEVRAGDDYFPGREWRRASAKSQGLRGKPLKRLADRIRRGDYGRVDSLLVVRNGYQKSNDVFGKNNRVRHLRLVSSQGETQTLTLQDRSGSETLLLPKPIKAYWVKFVIDDVWAGDKYPDTALTKLVVNSEPAQ